ncbi:MAG: site-specific DNA-methyltransferase [Cetobacterium sp.]
MRNIFGEEKKEIVQEKIFDNLNEGKLFPEIENKIFNVDKERIEKLKELFPNIVSDNKIDWKTLKLMLGENITEDDERYRFTWSGKSKAIREVNIPTASTLRPDKETSKNWENTENLYIEGDNLEVLKILQNSYNGKIKMIYIDPPYNTGNDFIYNDNFTLSAEETEKQEGLKDKKGATQTIDRLTKNSKDSAKYHTNWLNMMYPRLSIARDLLTEDGIICIQIDDNEQSNLKKICDEIYGETNFITTISVKMSEATGVKMSHASTRIPKLKEYILVYGKGEKIKLGNINIPKGAWDSEYKTFLNNITKEEAEIIKIIRDNEERTINEINLCDTILSKIEPISLSNIYKEKNILREKQEEFNNENSWRIIRTASVAGGAKTLADEKKKETSDLFYSIITPEKKVYFIKGDYQQDISSPRIKVLFADDYLTVNPCDFWQDIKTTGLDNEGEIDFKNGKKPLKLILRLMKLFIDKNDIVLDFFSGSATTGHALMQLNSEDNGNRKVILVQFPEDLDQTLLKVDSETKKTIKKTIEFLDSIRKPHFLSEVGKERIRRAGKKILTDNSDKDLSKLDIGFKTFKVDSSNFNEWDMSYEAMKKAVLQSSKGEFTTYKSDRNNLDLVYEIILKEGMLLTEKIEEIKIKNDIIYKIADGVMYVFLGRLTNEIIEEIVEMKKEAYDELGLDNPTVILNETYLDTEIKSNAKKNFESNGILSIKTL